MPTKGTGASYDEGDALRRLRRRISKPEQALTAIGALVTARSTARFAAQKFGTQPWPPRAIPNVMGTVADLEAGRGFKERRLQDRPALVDYGRLKGSISWRITGPREVEIGTNLPYAAKLQYGGTSTLPVTKKVKDGLAALLRQRPELRPFFGFLFNLDEVSTEIPARRFVGLDAQDRRDVRRIAELVMSGQKSAREVRRG